MGTAIARCWPLPLFALWAVLGCSEGDPVSRGDDDEMQTPVPRAPSAPTPPRPTPPRMPEGTPGTAGSADPMTDGGMPPGTVRDGMDADASATSVPPPPMLVICEEDDAGVIEQDGCVVVGDVRLQYRAANTQPADQQSQPVFNLVNEGSEDIPLTELHIRYWFSDSSSTAPFMFWCDYAQIDCANVQGIFVEEERSEADHYLEVSFSGGTLAAGQQTGEIQTRFNRSDWPQLDESDDYSFDALKTGFEDWHKATLYLGDELIWGAEPE